MLVTEIIEAVHRASRDTQGLPGPTSIGVPSTVQVRTPWMP